MAATASMAEPVAAAEALEGIRVLDLSQSVAGQFCARLFADNGASVILAEPENGSATRSIGPFAGGRSMLFAHLNAGKHGVRAADPDHLAALAAGADLVIVDAGIDPPPGAGLVCRITPFGVTGPLAGWGGSEMIYQALSGTMYENGRVEGPPLYGVGHRASYAAGAIGYVQAVAALLGGPAPRLIDVAIAEVAASMSFNRITQFSYNGEIEGRDIRTIPRALVRCADGWVSVFIYDNRWRHACRGLGLDDLADDPRFATEPLRLRNWAAFTAELDSRLADRPVDDVVAAGQRERAVIARAMAPSELLTEPQLAARSYWSRGRSAAGVPRLGPMYRMSATPQRFHRDAPDEHSPTTARWPEAPVPLRQAAGDGLPLRGIRVLDLTTAWSGPMATRILAALGASVTKIEGPGRIDDWRGPVGGGLGARYPDGEPGARPFDRCYQFNTQNHDKRSLVVDAKSPDGIEVLLRLADRADVMIANFAAGTLDRMGLGWSVVHARNPRLILVEMPAYGADGPIRDHVALGPSMELMAGMARLIGYGDGKPVTTGPAYLDPLGGFNSATAVLTALAARASTGSGQHVEIAQREAAMHWIGEEILYAAATGSDREPRGNRHDTAVPHDAFPTAGADEWVAIAAFGDQEFAALVSVIGESGLAADPRFATAAARARCENELNAIIAAWTAGRDKHDVAATLQAAGVHAAPVQNARDLHASQFLRARGLIQRLTHPQAGTHDYQGLPLHTEGWDFSIRQPAPTFGQHNAEVLAEIGYDDAAIAALEGKAVIATHPR